MNFTTDGGSWGFHVVFHGAEPNESARTEDVKFLRR